MIWYEELNYNQNGTVMDSLQLQIGEEAMSCRTNAVLFNLSYFSKFFITGPQAQKAANWIFTADLDKPVNK